MKDNTKKWSTTHPLIRLLAKILLYNILIILIVIVIGWYRGWNTGYEFGGGIVMGGILLIALGLLSVIGHWNATRDFNIFYTQSMSTDSSGTRNKRAMIEAMGQYIYLFHSFLAGLVAIIIGSVIQTYA